MKKTITLLFLLCLISCNDEKFITEYYPDGALKIKIQVDDKEVPNGSYEEYYNSGQLKVKGRYKNGEIIDTIVYYYKNGKIEEKGLTKHGFRIGWWTLYDSLGILKDKSEYLHIRKGKGAYKNQTVNFKKNGDTLFEKSSFFKIRLPDTLIIGKNIGQMKYNSNFSSKDKFFFILIDNQISDSEVIHDTFIDEGEWSRFGIYAHKEGLKNVKGIIIETVMEVKDINKDSSQLMVKEHRKYFEKKVYVKDR